MPLSCSEAGSKLETSITLCTALFKLELSKLPIFIIMNSKRLRKYNKNNNDDDNGNAMTDGFTTIVKAHSIGSNLLVKHYPTLLGGVGRCLIKAGC